MHIENSTVYNRELLNESVKAITIKYKCVIAAAVIILGAMLGLIAFGMHGSFVSIFILIVGIVAVLAIGYIRINGYKKAWLDRLRVVHHDDSAIYKYEIDDEKIVVTAADNTNTLYHKDIKKIKELKNQYMILYSGNVVIILSRKGFDEGGEATFKEFTRG